MTEPESKIWLVTINRPDGILIETLKIEAATAWQAVAGALRAGTVPSEEHNISVRKGWH